MTMNSDETGKADEAAKASNTEKVVIYRDGKAVTDRPADDVIEIFRAHLREGDPDYNPGDATAGAAFRLADIRLIGWKANRDTNRTNAKLSRTRDQFTVLLKRTFKALQKRTTEDPRPRQVIEALGKYDDESILRPRPDAVGQYGKSPDPKRTHWDQESKQVFWFDGERDRSITEAQIRDRLRKIRD